MKTNIFPPSEQEILRAIDNNRASSIIILGVQVPYCNVEEHPVYGQQFFTQKGMEEYEAVQDKVELDSQRATDFYRETLPRMEMAFGVLEEAMQENPPYFDPRDDESIFSTHVVELTEIVDGRFRASFRHPNMMNYAERNARNLIRRTLGNNALR